MSDVSPVENEPAKSPDALSVTYYENPTLISEMAWIDKVSKLKDFEGNIDNAGTVLKRMSDGISATTKLLHEEGESGYKPPGLAIAEGDQAKKMTVVHNQDQQIDAVVISDVFLANLSKLDFSRMGTIDRLDGTATFEGNVRDYGFLMGVEEAHHSFYTQKTGTASEFVNGSNMPVEQYDAIEHEYQALLFQLKAAEYAELPQETIDFLQGRIDRATKYRQTNRSNPV